MTDKWNRHPNRNQAGWIEEYGRRESLFMHDGNPRRPHALLRSKKHSDGFFNSRPLIADEKLMREVAHDLLVRMIQFEGFDIETVDRAVGPQTGATRLAEFLAAEIGACRGRPCAWASPKKITDETGEVVGMEFGDPDHCVLPGERVLLCEDVMTTGGSVRRTLEAVFAKGGSAMSFVGMIVNRLEDTSVMGLRLVALVERHLPTYDVPGGEACPLCAAGSEAIPPKDNWSRMIAPL